MIYVGKHVHVTVQCGDCGKPILNQMAGRNSAFIVGSCQNSECESFCVQMTIERSSMQVIAVDVTPSSSDGKRIYPMMADKDGKQVWPKPEPPKVEEPHPTQNRHRFVSRPDILECGVCGRGMEEVIHL
jgi:hypothetical protein